ncbi:hypothetical protein D3C79_716670 [compost metagenome]
MLLDLFDAGAEGGAGAQQRQAFLLELGVAQPHQLVLGAGEVVAIETLLHGAVLGGLARDRGTAVAGLRVHVAVDAAAALVRIG